MLVDSFVDDDGNVIAYVYQGGILIQDQVALTPALALKFAYWLHEKTRELTN